LELTYDFLIQEESRESRKNPGRVQEKYRKKYRRIKKSGRHDNSKETYLYTSKVTEIKRKTSHYT